MFNLENELQILQELIRNNNLDEIKDLMYDTDKQILALTGSSEQIQNETVSLRSNYRAKIKAIQDHHRQALNTQWEVIKAGLVIVLDTPGLDLQNNSKTKVLWDLIEKRKFHLGYKAMIEEFKELLPLITE